VNECTIFAGKRGLSPIIICFHIYLNPPAVQDIIKSANLLGSNVMEGGVESVVVTPTQTTYSALSGAEEVVMLAFTVPAVPPQAPTVMIAQVQQSPTTVTFCLDKQSLVPDSAPNSFSPIGQDFLEKIGRPYTGTDAEAQQYKVTLLGMPKHGQAQLVYEPSQHWTYLPEEGYEGADRVTYLVEGQGKQYKVVINFWVVGVLDEDRKAQYCDSVDFGASNGLITPPAGLKPLTMSNFTAWQNEAQFASLLNTVSNITVTFADLTGGALGQTTGSTITLDTTASGNGWFIDTTPSDNSEYLPTSTPNEWIAKAGSAAAGKMDMLSVLLHEYGHALGIDHNPNAHDYMGTTLTAGVRRLPTADEMALMQQLIAQAKSGLIAQQSTTNTDLPNTPSNAPFPTLPLGGMGLAFAGLLQRNRYGGLNAVLNNSTLTQYDVAANATLTNGNLSSGNGWATQGSVNIGNGVATLNEISTTQTRLSQVFMVNANDRYLSFTLSGAALDNLTGAPDDAFEVALLNANTGVSLLGSNGPSTELRTGLTHSDAFLNLQADGTEHLSQGITRITNPDGSRTYRVDLSGVASGTAVNLSFDLIGFGANGSHVNVSDVRLSGLPQLHDDAATILEDGTLSFNPFAQADNAVVLQLGSQVVDQPVHGAVTLNADGTFNYTPTLNYNGTDSFTYRLNDGALQSNLATVSVTLTAVNDAPVAADVALTTAEDTALVIVLNGYGSDVDSTTLTTTIVTGPTHGVLVANADGTYSYTPAANYFGADSFTYKVNDGALDSNLATVNLTVTAVNDAPVIADLNLAGVEDTSLVMNLLAAATDVDSDVLTASIVAGALHGQVTLNADGSFTYTNQA
jgi:VCBS repeat-containing protein